MNGRRFPRRILAGLVLLGTLAAAAPALADYLGPNRTVTTWVWRRLHCHYQAIYDPPGAGWWGCYLNLYYPPDGSCPTDVAAYFTPSDCSWPEAFCQTRGCSISRTSSIVSCREGESGCRAVPQTVTHPEATVSGSVTCSTPGSGGWCRGGAALSLSGSEPLSGCSILALEGTRNGETFACPGSSCSVPLVEGTNDFTFWALSSWGDSSRMGTASGRLDSGPPAISGQVTGTAGENGWYVSEVTVTAGADDAVSGVAAFEVSLGESGWRPYSGALALSDGEHRLDLRAFDVAGNSAGESLSVRVDTVPPEVTLTAGGSFCPGCGQRLEVSLSVADGGSGVGEWSLSVGGVVLCSGDDAVSDVFSWHGSGLGAGTHTLSLEASDHAGNTAETTLNIWLIAPTPVPPSPTSPPQGAPGAGGGGASGPLNPSGGASPTQAPGPSATPISTRTPNPTRTPSTSSFGGAPAGQQGGIPGMSVGGGAGSVGGAWPGSSSAGDAATATSTTSSGVLWGAAAAVLIAAATAAALEAARRRQEEEERVRAEMERKNAEAEAREAEARHLAWLAALAAAAAAAAKDKGASQSAAGEEERPSDMHFRGMRPPQTPAAAQPPPFDLAKWKQQEYAGAQPGGQSGAPPPLPLLDDRGRSSSTGSRSDSMRRTAERRDEPVPPPASLDARTTPPAVPYISPMPYHAPRTATPHPLVQRGLDWIDRRQREVATVIGFVVGAGVTVLTAPALGPASIPLGIAAGAAAGAGFTAALNAHYDRPLTENLLRNTAYSTVGGVVGSTGGFAAVKGGLGKLALGVGNAVTGICVRLPAVCAYAEPVLRFVDRAEELVLSAQLSVETALRLPRAGETALELQLERMDGGAPGNTTFRAIYEDAATLLARHSHEAAQIASVARRHSDNVLEVVDDGLLRVRSEAVEEIAEELEAATGRRVWFFPRTGAIYLSQPTQAGVHAVARLRMAVQSGADEETISRLVEEVAMASTRGSGRRLVLGAWQEGSGYIGEAVENGGIFFDTGEEVWEALRNSGIDPWLVNEAFLRQQLEAGVERIEFVGENVDRLLSAYGEIAFHDLPYFRLKELRWLENNAAAYGYVRAANSWIKASP